MGKLPGVAEVEGVVELQVIVSGLIDKHFLPGVASFRRLCNPGIEPRIFESLVGHLAARHPKGRVNR